LNRDIGAPGGDFAISAGRRSIDRLKERQAMRRRIRVAVALRRLDTLDMEPETPVAKPAE
jgi:hypothetical protein